MKNSKDVTNLITRRGFLGSASAAAALIALPGQAIDAQTAGSAEPAKAMIKSFRTLGRTGFQVSDVSFGTGDLNNATVLAASLDRGINYLDTAEHYVNGVAERTIGEAIKNRPRKSLFITTKLNLSMNPDASKQAIKARFQKCLERMQTDYADCLMIHMCTLAQVKHEPYHEAIAELKAEGRVRFSGLSNHGSDLSLYGRLDDPMDKVIMAAVDDGRFDVVLFVYNYLKTEIGDKILAACKSKDMGTTLMKMDPAYYVQWDQNYLQQLKERYKTKGTEIPAAVHDFERFAQERATRTAQFLKKYNLQSPAEARAAAIKFCLNQQLVHCVCPSINTFADMEAFVALSGQKMAAADAKLLADYSAAAADLYCRHACGACEASCPQGVPVNAIMRFDYYFKAKGQEKKALGHYAALGERNAQHCAACPGHCQRACPHGVPIHGKLLVAHDMLSLV